jgi:hypothetical protein
MIIRIISYFATFTAPHRFNPNHYFFCITGTDRKLHRTCSQTGSAPQDNMWKYDIMVRSFEQGRSKTSWQTTPSLDLKRQAKTRSYGGVK